MFLPAAGTDTQNRLLPPDAPFGFFAAAVGLHAAGWLVLLAAGVWETPAWETSAWEMQERIVDFRGGPGAVLAALHLMTVGVLALTAMGAGLQLLPMATVRPVKAVGWARLAFWLAAPGAAILAFGMAAYHQAALAWGGGLAAAGLAVFLALTADNLRAGGDMPAARQCGGVAAAAGAAMAVLGLALALDFHLGFLPDRAGAAAAHLALGLYGFMGMLAAGFSTILLPMLTMAPAPSPQSGLAVAQLGAGGLAAAACGALLDLRWLVAAGIAAGLAAAAVHIRAMLGVLRARMRQRLDTGFFLIRGGWVGLVLSLLAALALSLGYDVGNLPAAFVALAVLGWLLPTALGVLQRIAPFLAAIHATRPGRRMPLVSALAPERPLQIHAALHGAAVLLLVAGFLTGFEPAARLGAALGAGGAFCLIFFAATLYRRVRAHLGEA